MARYDPLKHHRQSMRMRGFDYAQPGEDFVTLVTQERKSLFGEITGEQRCWMPWAVWWNDVATRA